MTDEKEHGMSDDGADLGIGAEQALGIVIGGEPQPEESEKVTPAGMREKLMAVTLGQEFDYDSCATMCGRLVLEFFDAHPEKAHLSASQDYNQGEVPPEGNPSVQLITDGPPKLYTWTTSEDLYGLVKAFHGGEESQAYKRCLSDLTGFMWGWAVNAAKYALNLPPVANPAIMTIG